MLKTCHLFVFITLLIPITFDRSWGAELILFEQPGCEWCELWDEEVGEIYHKTEEGRSAPLHRHDIDTPLPAKYDFIKGVVFTPTFVLVDGGKEMGRITGYPGEDHFWGMLGEMLNAPTDVQATEIQPQETDADS